MFGWHCDGALTIIYLFDHYNGLTTSHPLCVFDAMFSHHASCKPTLRGTVYWLLVSDPSSCICGLENEVTVQFMIQSSYFCMQRKAFQAIVFVAPAIIS